MNDDITYISPLGFVIDETEIELRRKQIEEVAKFLLFSDDEYDSKLKHCDDEG